MAIANMQVQFDDLFWLFTYLAIAVSMVVFGLMVFFIVKYREKPGSAEPNDAPILGRLPVPRGHARTAILTVSLSTIILGALVIGSFGSIDTILSTPAPCNIRISDSVSYNCSVLVTGHRFYWDFNYAGYPYPNQTITGAPLDQITPQSCQTQRVCVFAVPVGYDIRLNITGADVFHNFGVIAFKVKADAYPGHINNIWFNADATGNYTIQCYEFCGTGHLTMVATLDVMPLAQFQSWFNSTIVR
jgi:cytochrome c oxidase subunit II